MSNNKFESLLELLINEENDKAEALFHEIVVEKSRDIYENLADEEVTAEAMHDKKMKKEDEVDEAMHGDKEDKKKKKECPWRTWSHMDNKGWALPTNPSNIIGHTQHGQPPMCC